MNAYKFDPIAQTLTLSAAFAEALNNPESKETCLVRQFRSDYPNLRIERRTHATPKRYRNSDGSITSHQRNKKITYENMEKFMRALPNGGQKYLDEYNALREVCGICPSPYTYVRRWFEAQFPLFRINPIFYVKNEVDVIDFSAFIKANEVA